MTDEAVEAAESRRRYAEEQIERMRRAACGGSERAYAWTRDQSFRHAMAEAGADQTLTRSEWEAEAPSRALSSPSETETT